MAIKVTYLSTKTIQKKKRITEQVDAKLSKIRYRDSKNKIVKFDARKKLRVEVTFRVKRGVKYKTVISTSYGLPLRKRKKPVPEKIIHNQIQKKHQEKIKRGHLIVYQTDSLHNLYAWTYFYQDKTKEEKAKIRRDKIKRLKKARQVRINNLLKIKKEKEKKKKAAQKKKQSTKRSRNGRNKTRKS